MVTDSHRRHSNRLALLGDGQVQLLEVGLQESNGVDVRVAEELQRRA
jgi:hypothetical protein